MPRYRLECAHHGRHGGWTSWFVVANDMMAISEAARISEGKDCKVWDEKRLVAHFRNGIAQAEIQ